MKPLPLALTILAAFPAILLTAEPMPAQVSGVVEIVGGHGRALIRNASENEMGVEVALWESEETGDRVQLLRPAHANVWPTDVRLLPGEVQTVRFRVPGEAYPIGTLLRLETRLVPIVADAHGSTPGTSVRLIFATRILSKVWIR